jgi:E3 ubiquitin-protein ligase synoviolin
MTVFRDEFNTRFVVMFVSLLFVKCFHWICQDRIDYVRPLPDGTDFTRWSNFRLYLGTFMRGWYLPCCSSLPQMLHSSVMLLT